MIFLYGMPIPIAFKTLASMTARAWREVIPTLPGSRAAYSLLGKPADDEVDEPEGRLWRYLASADKMTEYCRIFIKDYSTEAVTASSIEVFYPRLDWPQGLSEIYAAGDNRIEHVPSDQQRSIRHGLAELRSFAEGRSTRIAIFRAFEAGLHACLLRDPEIARLFPSNPSITRRRRGGRPRDELRRQTINRLMEEDNLTAAEVAERLRISVHTVKHYRRQSPRTSRSTI
jgi:hypothetical protein